MNKRTFTVELAAENDSVNALTHEDFDYILRRGMVEYMGNFYAQNVKITFVEQTCGTVDFAEKSIGLLRKVCDVINSYERYDRTDYLDEIAGEIEEFLTARE